MKILYTAQVTATGGRSGCVASDDGLLEVDLALPAALGGKGGATNPEQLFAAGYAACFGNAVIHVTRNTHKIADNDVTVVGTVSMSPNAEGGFVLSVALDVAIAGVDQDTAEKIVAQAHEVCPYSKAVRGNVDVDLKVRAEA